MLLRSNSVGNGRITGVQRLMDGGSIPPSSTGCFFVIATRSDDEITKLGLQAVLREASFANTRQGWPESLEPLTLLHTHAR